MQDQIVFIRTYSFQLFLFGATPGPLFIVVFFHVLRNNITAAVSSMAPIYANIRLGVCRQYTLSIPETQLLFSLVCVECGYEKKFLYKATYTYTETNSRKEQK